MCATICFRRICWYLHSFRLRATEFVYFNFLHLICLDFIDSQLKNIVRSVFYSNGGVKELKFIFSFYLLASIQFKIDNLQL